MKKIKDIIKRSTEVAIISKLQLETGKSMMDCQRALNLNEWNYIRALNYLKTIK